MVVAFRVPIEIEWVKGKVEAAASEVLGRPFVFEGPLILVPSLPPTAHIEGVHLWNPEGWPGTDLARI